MNPEVHISRFYQTRDLRELQSAIDGYRRALARDTDPALLSSLGDAMSMRFDALGQEADLTEAIDLHRRAVAALSGRPGLAEAQASLAAVLTNPEEEITVGVTADDDERLGEIKAAMGQRARAARGGGLVVTMRRGDLPELAALPAVWSIERRAFY